MREIFQTDDCRTNLCMERNVKVLSELIGFCIMRNIDWYCFGIYLGIDIDDVRKSNQPILQ